MSKLSTPTRSRACPARSPSLGLGHRRARSASRACGARWGGGPAGRPLRQHRAEAASPGHSRAEPGRGAAPSPPGNPRFPAGLGGGSGRGEGRGAAGAGGGGAGGRGLRRGNPSPRCPRSAMAPALLLVPAALASFLLAFGTGVEFVRFASLRPLLSRAPEPAGAGERGRPCAGRWAGGGSGRGLAAARGGAAARAPLAGRPRFGRGARGAGRPGAPRAPGACPREPPGSEAGGKGRTARGNEAGLQVQQ